MAIGLGLTGCGPPTGLQILNQAREAYRHLKGYREEAQVTFLQAGPGVIRSQVWFGRGLGSVATITFPTRQQLFIYSTSSALYLVNPGYRSVMASAPEGLPVEAASLGSLLQEIPVRAKLRYLGAMSWRGLSLERVGVLSPYFRGEIDFGIGDKLPRLLILRDGRGEPVLRQEIIGLKLNPLIQNRRFQFHRPAGYSFRWRPGTGRSVDRPGSGD